MCHSLNALTKAPYLILSDFLQEQVTVIYIKIVKYFKNERYFLVLRKQSTVVYTSLTFCMLFH